MPIGFSEERMHAQQLNTGAASADQVNALAKLLQAFAPAVRYRPSNVQPTRTLQFPVRVGGGMAATAMNFKNKHKEGRLTSAYSMYNAVDLDPLHRKAQIVATLGPASDSEDILRKLIKAGVNIFRLNSSHRRKGQFEQLIPLIRKIAGEEGVDVKILGDIQGPKFRCSLTENDEPVRLEEGAEVRLALAGDNDPTRPGHITLDSTTEQAALIRGLRVGMKLLLDDGLLKIEVLKCVSENEVTCKVLIGGKLKSRKGINVPELQIDCSALTKKDREDAKFLLNVQGGVDYIALSFAQKGQDIQELIDLMDSEGIATDRRPAIIPKIEKPAALQNIDEILELSDGLMVARGDLGVELGPHRVPFAQKFLIRKANQKSKFCITATQTSISETSEQKCAIFLLSYMLLVYRLFLCLQGRLV